ncbi:AraC family transcriptional regulator [uncultured Draconibacterium sp.]|uniref:helix-turn-helix domain-containing protein n=1 Tax=uncultured Draconibacterium sp. TaxID=1573823 RepID=UPI00321701A1
MIKAIALLTPIYVSFFWCSVFIFSQKEQRHPKNYLGYLMLMALLLYISHAIFFNNLYIVYSYIESIYFFSMLSMYPLYYIYILLRSGKSISVKSQLKHFLPAIILFTLSLTSTFLISSDDRILYVKDILMDKNLKVLNMYSLTGLKGIFFFTARLILVVQVIFYASSGIKTANEFNKKVANYYSNIEGRTLQWVRDLNIAILIVAVASISFSFIGRSYFSKHEISLLIPSFIFSSVLFYIGFKGNQQTDQLEKMIEENDNQEEFAAIKSEHEEKLKSQIIKQFEMDKVHTNPDLRITTISEKLGTNRTYISRLINEEFGMNFNEFVNKYRLTEAKELLCSKNHNIYTMEHIAEMAGFGSAASFSRVFKESEGLTPGNYRNKMQNNSHNTNDEKKEISSDR